MISDQSEARRTQADPAGEDNFQFVCSEDVSGYIHEPNVIWDM